MISLKQNKQSGFTLLELLIALVIFSVGILGVYSMQLSAVTGNSKSRIVTEATRSGAEMIETVISMAYDNDALDDDDGDGTDKDADNDGEDDTGNNFGLDDQTSPDGSILSADGHYQVLWNVAVDYPLPNTKTIRFYVMSSGLRAKPVAIDFVKFDQI